MLRILYGFEANDMRVLTKWLLTNQSKRIIPSNNDFVYDLDSLPKSIARYFCPVSLERARSAISLLIINNRNNSIDQTPNISNSFAEILSRQLVKVAKAYVEKQVNHAQESIIYEIYTKAMSELLDMKKNSLLSKEIALNLHNRWCWCWYTQTIRIFMR